MEEKYTLGIDFGTLSARAVLVRTSDGTVAANASADYPHGVISDTLPSTGEKLPPAWALQDPSDYTFAMGEVINRVISLSGIRATDIIGIGIDFTNSTLLPVCSDGTPLCLTDRWKDEKHAWCKLWKHHSTQPYADKLAAVLSDRGGDLLSSFGGTVSPEWALPKALETLSEAPEVYRDCSYFLEAGDWINLVLTGRPGRSYVLAASKAFYRPGIGFPSSNLLAQAAPELSDFYIKKFAGPVIPLGVAAGRISPEAAARFGLAEGTPVAPAGSDAQIAALALGSCEPGDMIGIMGTSNCYFLLSREKKEIPGICGYVRDGQVPGLYSYEAGLCCMGDHFAWAARNVCPRTYADEADSLGISPLKLLIDKASKKRPGETGLLALDWWNGNRSVLVNGRLSGLMIGMTLSTRPEDIMRALIEATAFGTRIIFDNYTSRGMKINKFTVAGGIARKDPFTVQLYSDVLRMPVTVTSAREASALGSAIHAAAVAGREAGGYGSITEAVSAMSAPPGAVHVPDPENEKIYDLLYREYVKLHDYFGRGENRVMDCLRCMKD